MIKSSWMFALCLCAAAVSGCGGGSDPETAAINADPAVATLGATLVPSDVAAPTLEAELIPDFAAGASTASEFPAELRAPIS